MGTAGHRPEVPRGCGNRGSRNGRDRQVFKAAAWQPHLNPDSAICKLEKPRHPSVSSPIRGDDNNLYTL